MRNRLRLRLQHLIVIEAALVGLFFVSATRFLIGTAYSRFGSASIVLSLDPAIIPAGAPGVVDSATLSSEISFLVYMIALPLLTLLLGRFRLLSVVAALLIAVGRALMLTNSVITPLASAAMVFGGGLIYLAMIVRYRAQIIPYLFILGLAVDQLFRIVGNTVDPSWSPNYLNVQLILSVVLVVISIITAVGERRGKRIGETAITPDYGLMPFWGGIGLGALLFLEISLLGVPNAIAGRSSSDYTNFAPLVMLATVLPLIPAVRSQAASFLSLFDKSVRGWAWTLVMGLLIVFGTRFQGILAGAALVIAQFLASMIWWWLVRPRAEKERQFTGLWLVVAVVIFLVLAAADNFTYEYAYVQNMPPDLAFLDKIIPPFLRGFRGMGLGVLLLAVFLAALPMIQTQRRIPWTGGTRWQSFLGLVAAVGLSVAAAVAVRPPVIAGVRNPETLRIATYNIHGGFNEFYSFDLEAMARAIQRSGANVVLLQQVETGRMTSFSADEPLWLARRLGMDTRFFPTNEGLEGLAVLSNVEIVYDDGVLLTSAGNQTGLQRVQIRPDNGVITLYNTQLEFLLQTGDGRTIDEQEQEQQRQLNEIFTVLASHYPDGNPGRMLMGGTFNNIPDSVLGDQMRAAGFVDPFAGQANEISATLWRTGYPHVRLDYLWVWRRSLIPIGANTIDSSASDHRLAVIEAAIASQ
jgi:endonuclease/exonuclease/phosphatase family metal-dependent hydrolase